MEEIVAIERQRRHQIDDRIGCIGFIGRILEIELDITTLVDAWRRIHNASLTTRLHAIGIHRRLNATIRSKCKSIFDVASKRIRSIMRIIYSRILRFLNLILQIVDLLLQCRDLFAHGAIICLALVLSTRNGIVRRLPRTMFEDEAAVACVLRTI